MAGLFSRIKYSTYIYASAYVKVGKIEISSVLTCLMFSVIENCM